MREMPGESGQRRVQSFVFFEKGEIVGHVSTFARNTTRTKGDDFFRGTFEIGHLRVNSFSDDDVPPMGGRRPLVGIVSSDGSDMILLADLWR